MMVKSTFVKLLQKPELFFAATAAFFGGLFILLTPPLQGPDEQAHFAQVYRYSTGDMGSTLLPAGVINMFNTVLYNDDIRFKGNEKYEIGRTKDALLNIALDKTNIKDGLPYGGTGYSPIAYVVSVFLVFLGSLVDSPAIVLIYLARIGGLISFISLVYLATKMTPIGKLGIVLVGLLPMSVFSASVVSSDAVTLGAMCLFVAVVLRLSSQTRAVSLKQYTYLFLITVILLLTKTINIVFLPLLLLIPLNQDRPRFMNRYGVVAIIAILATGCMFIWQASAPMISNSSVSNIPKNVVPAQQVELILTAPHKFLFAFWNTYFYAWGDGIFYSLIGTFGWADAPMPVSVVIFGYTILILVMLVNRDQDRKKLQKLNRFSKPILVGVMMLYFIAVNAGMYIFYSPVDFNIIVGLQGRYFIPVLVLLTVLTYPLKLRTNEKISRFLLPLAPIILLSTASVYIYVRYYINTII